MNIIEHGRWGIYQPEKPPKDFPPNVLYAKRQGDGFDWYEYIHGKALTEHFTAGNLVATAYWREDLGAFFVGAVTDDVSRLFPGADALILEIEGYAGADAQQELGGKAYDPDTKTFSDFDYAALPNPINDMQKQIDELKAILAEMRR